MTFITSYLPSSLQYIVFQIVCNKANEGQANWLIYLSQEVRVYTVDNFHLGE